MSLILLVPLKLSEDLKPLRKKSKACLCCNTLPLNPMVSTGGFVIKTSFQISARMCAVLNFVKICLTRVKTFTFPYTEVQFVSRGYENRLEGEMLIHADHYDKVCCDI